MITVFLLGVVLLEGFTGELVPAGCLLVGLGEAGVTCFGRGSSLWGCLRLDAGPGLASLARARLVMFPWLCERGPWNLRGLSVPRERPLSGLSSVVVVVMVGGGLGLSVGSLDWLQARGD